MAETWEQRLRAAAEWMRERHATATTSRRSDGSLPGGRVISAEVMLDCPEWPRHAHRGAGVVTDDIAEGPGQHAAQLVAALVAMAPAIAGLLEGEAAAHAKSWTGAYTNPLYSLTWCSSCDREHDECVPILAVKPIVEAVEAVRGGVTA